ncbi:flagellar hook-associated protein FlgK [Deferribacterales bacterium RsTz2092]|nr:flagellar hook-associated protein FlgK [Deferribacterales bacterium]
MSNLFGMLYTGVSGLLTTQVQMDVTGHNIANINNPNYTRQRANIVSTSVSVEQNGAFGSGVKVAEVVRIYDELLVKTLRKEASALSYWTSTQEVMIEVKTYFNELEQDMGSGLGEPLDRYFKAWQDLANTAPDGSSDSAVRRTELIETSISLVTTIKESRSSIVDIQRNIDDTLKTNIDDINMLAVQIADYNKQIRLTEASGEHANDLRDQRDTLINQINELANVSVIEQPNGACSVYLAGMPIVDGAESSILYTASNSETGGKLDIYWSTGNWYDKGRNITSMLDGGSIAGKVNIRDGLLENYISQLDALATALIDETNKLHSAGQGLMKYSSLTAGNPVGNPEYALGSKVGSFPSAVQEGTFRINVYDAGGNLADTYDIAVNPNVDTLNGIATKIRLASDNLSADILKANVDRTGAMQLSVPAGYTFSFGTDTSNFLSAAGFNGFFTGKDASDINVNKFLEDNPSYIATKSEGGNGNNDVALSIANLRTQKVMQKQTLSLEGFYAAFVGQVAIDKQQVDIFVATRTMTVTEYTKRLQSVSGVSETEEMTNMSMLQRVFEANSRYVNAVDQMLQIVVSSLGLVGR